MRRAELNEKGEGTRVLRDLRRFIYGLGSCYLVPSDTTVSYEIN